MDGLLQQFISANTFDNLRFLRQCQREFRDRLAPMLEERDALLVERDVLTQQVVMLCTENDMLRKRLAKKGAADAA